VGLGSLFIPPDQTDAELVRVSVVVVE